MNDSRAFFVLLGLVLTASPAAALDLPVRYPGREPVALPAYRGDALVIALAPGAARDARVARPAGMGESARPASRGLGVPAVERVASGLGGARFERVFQGESAPPEGSDEPDFTSYFRVHLPPGTDLEDALARFRALPEVAAADPIAILRVSATPNDPSWSSSWWYYQTPAGGIRAPEAWDMTRGDSAVVVAIVDTGVLPYHPDLAGTELGLAGNLWTNWQERGGIADWDDDGNGFIDDVAGWDFVNRPSASGITPGEDWETPDNDPSDFAGHGTMVAGIVGALTDNATGVAGVAWNVRLMPLRMGWSESGAELGAVDMSYAAAAIRYATRMGASVINCSFETRNESDLFPATTAAVRAGITIVCSAGNAGQLHELQNRTDVISVGASDMNDAMASFSLTGPYVDLMAPGLGITSTFLAHSGEKGAGPPEPAYAALSGTSFAAPFVSGAAALIHSRRRALGLAPLGAHTMMFRMRETADDVSAANPARTGYGAGRLNLARAISDPPTSFARKAGAIVTTPAVVLTMLSGRPRIAFGTSDRKILLIDAETADTMAIATLPTVPAPHIAAADMGGGYGVCLFVGTGAGRVAGFDSRLGTLPGWPVAGVSLIHRMDAGPALGDLDGDGVLEVVCGSSDGNLWAWRPDGTLLDGFPFESGTESFVGDVALGDLDGLPGVEIVAASRDGLMHAIRSDGSELPGWPVTAPASASPMILGLGHSSAPAVAVCAGSSIMAFGADGIASFTMSLGGTVTQDAAVGDLDGDGADEIVAAYPGAIAVVDSMGSPTGIPGWPRTYSGTLGGPVLIGRLQPGTRPGVYVFAGGNQLAFSDDGVVLREFPKPGGAGAMPTIAEIDGDGRSEVIAGTGTDSVLYNYDAGADTWGAGSQPWGTPRANFARTGNRLYAPPIGIVDDVAPQTIATFRPDSLRADRLVLRWTAPGDDGASGRASLYQLQMTARASAAGNFVSGAILTMPPPDTAGTAQRRAVTGLAPGTRYFFALRARDDQGNWSTPAVASVMTALSRPRPARDEGGPAIAVRVDRVRLPITVAWRAPETLGAARTIDLYDVSGRRVRRMGMEAGTEGAVLWDGTDGRGRRMPAGLYFARLTCGSLRAQARVVLIP